MCGAFGLTSKIKKVEKRFEAECVEVDEILPRYNIRPGQDALVIVSDEPKKIQCFHFGIYRSYGKKNIMHINTRAEGIVYKPAFMKNIRSKRCLVIADYFIEGTIIEKLSKPYLVYLRNKVRPFAMAAIWDTWQHKESNEQVNSFSIITTKSNALISMFPKDRMPVILSYRNEKKWLKDTTPLSDITNMLLPYNAELMNAYPISPAIKNPKSDDKELIMPTGERLTDERKIVIKQEMTRTGFGRHRIKFDD